MEPELLQPSNKRQKLDVIQNDMKYGVFARLHQPTQLVDRTKHSAFDSCPSLHNFPQIDTTTAYIRDYIPAGSIRITREDLAVSLDEWLSLSYWAAFSTPRDSLNQRDSPFLSSRIQNYLLKSPPIQPYKNLLNWELIRAEFKTNDHYHGQLRIYLLHRGLHDRRNALHPYEQSIQKATRHLFRHLDVCKLVWKGLWNFKVLGVPIVAAPSDVDDSGSDETLLSMFNNLPSPNPQYESVENVYAQEAMSRLLCGDVPGLVTNMYTYQRRSAALMIQREITPGLMEDPRLQEFVDMSGNKWYCDPDDGYYSKSMRMYDAPRGGILAENMGLGKTLICLGLILATRAQSSTIPPQYSIGLTPVRKRTGSLLQMAAAALNRHAMPWKEDFSNAEAQGLEYARAQAAIKDQPGHYYLAAKNSSRSSRSSTKSPLSRKVFLSTCSLVVVPANLFQQWINEINKHTTGLKVLVMQDMNLDLPTATEINDFDILLFTKSRFDKEARSGRFETSPLRNVHFKRLIYDEGHTFGSSSSSSQTEAFTLVNALHVSARWIVSGTPSQGLYSTVSDAFIESSKNSSKIDSVTTHPTSEDLPESNVNSAFDKFAVDQERKDLMKLGNIAMHFLKARPWAASPDGDVAYWQHYALQPRHGEKSRGNVACLRRTLESMMLRHRLPDVATDVRLPPLHESVVYLEPCLQNRLMLNSFALMIITNAITSERKDADYFFHPSQRTNLLSLVSNLRKGSFFWSGFEVEHIKKTVSIAQGFLDDASIPTSREDIVLLRQAIEYGIHITTNPIFQSSCISHEIPMHLQNDWPNIVRSALSIDSIHSNPTLISAPMLFDAQKYMHKTEYPTPQMMVVAAHQTLLSTQKKEKSSDQSDKSVKASGSKSTTPKKRAVPTNGVTNLAGAVTIGEDFAPRKLSRTITKTSHASLMDQNTMDTLRKLELELLVETPTGTDDSLSNNTCSSQISAKSKAKELEARRLAPKLRSFLNTSRIISTASTKLSYLLDRIIEFQANEKILVFYEDPNAAYYIAQYLECLNIKHLIYATELKAELRSRYVATFNTTNNFRVLLMDVSQAAFGLDISSASRIFFITPVFSPQIEAQAVKRAHRIGQQKPVFVETLVLKGSIEEVLVTRRNSVSNEAHQKIKSLLDDETLYDWIRNIQLIPMERQGTVSCDQMAPLKVPQPVFGKDSGSGYGVDPDADIVKVQDYVSERSTPEPSFIIPLPPLPTQSRALQWLSKHDTPPEVQLNVLRFLPPFTQKICAQSLDIDL